MLAHKNYVACYNTRTYVWECLQSYDSIMLSPSPPRLEAPPVHFPLLAPAAATHPLPRAASAPAPAVSFQPAAAVHTLPRTASAPAAAVSFQPAPAPSPAPAPRPPAPPPPAAPVSAVSLSNFDSIFPLLCALLTLSYMRWIVLFCAVFAL